MPLYDVTTLTEAFRRAVLRLFVRRELMDVETAQGANLDRGTAPPQFDDSGTPGGGRVTPITPRPVHRQYIPY